MLERSIVSDRLGNEWSRYMPRKKKDRFIRISDKHRASYSTICGVWFLTTPVIKRAATSNEYFITCRRTLFCNRSSIFSNRFQEKSIIVNVILDHAFILPNSFNQIFQRYLIIRATIFFISDIFFARRKSSIFNSKHI